MPRTLMAALDWYERRVWRPLVDAVTPQWARRLEQRWYARQNRRHGATLVQIADMLGGAGILPEREAELRAKATTLTGGTQ
jgi:hypothetical protein